jgi:YHS domain-containing protein
MLSLVLGTIYSAELSKKKGSMEVFQPLKDLIGDWKAIGQIENAKNTPTRGFWNESVHWFWQFQDGEAWFNVVFDNGKYFTKGTLKYFSQGETYRLTLTDVSGAEVVFNGTIVGSDLELTRKDESKNEQQKFVFSFLHDGRFLYRYETMPEGKTSFTRVYKVGVQKADVPKANDLAGAVECYITGGASITSVVYEGQTYYFCCGGCKSSFQEDPKKAIKEHNEEKLK